MEQLFLLIQQIYRDLNILSNYSPKEREELREGYFWFLDEIRDIIRALSRIIGGSTYWGWKFEWGCHVKVCPWCGVGLLFSYLFFTRSAASYIITLLFGLGGSR